ncbi:MAG TPA: alpha/beta hydrolase, partial [Gemmatimonadaceae bacterium]
QTAFLLVACALVACSSKRNGADGSDADQDATPAAQTSGYLGERPSDESDKAERAQPPGESVLSVTDGLIWYKASGEGQRGTPVILIHDGPGGSSFPQKPLEALSDERPVIRYDQLGSGKSQRVLDVSLYVLPNFVSDLELLRLHRRYQKVHLVGQGWGALVALEYYHSHPDHVASLTLGSPTLSYPALVKRADQLVASLPDSMPLAIRRGQRERFRASDDYQRAISTFYRTYVLRRYVRADLDSMAGFANDSIYNFMHGPDEATITGTLRAYDATPQLRTVRVPVLFTVGEFDEVDSVMARQFAALTPNARVVVFKGAAHFPMWEAPEEMVRELRDFLRRADALDQRR